MCICKYTCFVSKIIFAEYTDNTLWSQAKVPVNNNLIINNGKRLNSDLRQ